MFVADMIVPRAMEGNVFFQCFALIVGLGFIFLLIALFFNRFGFIFDAIGELFVTLLSLLRFPFDLILSLVCKRNNRRLKILRACYLLKNESSILMALNHEIEYWDSVDFKRIREIEDFVIRESERVRNKVVTDLFEAEESIDIKNNASQEELKDSSPFLNSQLEVSSASLVEKEELPNSKQ